MSSFLALQDEHGVSAEDFGKAMRAAADAGDGENPLFKLERGDITEAEFLDVLRDGLEPLLDHRPAPAPLPRDLLRARSTRTSR